jgi:EAL domain-containing protein (putative c-di-GMP-specific phosphodiesterase class I)
VDRSFVVAMDRQENLKIINTIISLGLDLNKTLIAEGVETKEQLEALRRLNCHFGQGYYFSKPLPETEAENLLKKRPVW